MANNGWRFALASGLARRLRRWSYGNEMRCAPAERSHCTQGGGGIPGLSPRATFRDSSGVLQGGDCVAPRALSSHPSCSCGCFPLNSGTRAIQPAGCGAPVPHFPLRGLRDLRGFIAHTKSVPNFRTSRSAVRTSEVPRAQAAGRPHRMPGRAHKCSDARTDRWDARTDSQVCRTVAGMSAQVPGRAHSPRGPSVSVVCRAHRFSDTRTSRLSDRGRNLAATSRN